MVINARERNHGSSEGVGRRSSGRAHCLRLAHTCHRGTRFQTCTSIADRNEDFLAILQLVNKPLVELRLIGIDGCSSERTGHDLAERPSTDLVVLVDVRDDQTLRRENDFGVVGEVKLKMIGMSAEFYQGLG